jgi:hypothetical protein
MATDKATISGVANSSLASECASALAECNSLNACFTTKGVLITDKCVQFLAKHADKISCLSQGFGIARPHD